MTTHVRNDVEWEPGTPESAVLILHRGQEKGDNILLRISYLNFRFNIFYASLQKKKFCCLSLSVKEGNVMKLAAKKEIKYSVIAIFY